MTPPYLGPDRARCKQVECARRMDCARYRQWLREGRDDKAISPTPPGIRQCGLYESAHSTPWHSHGPNRSTAADTARS